MIYFCIALFLSIVYVVLIFYVVQGWDSVKESKINNEVVHNLSIIIPIKNESVNIEKCIKSILNNTVFNGLYEIIIVDDHSTDDTLDILSNINNPLVKVFALSSLTGKKNAITYGISLAKYNDIVTLDGDCIVPNLWLAHIASALLNEKADVLVGPVKIKNDDNTLSQFECYDTAAMMAITANGIYRHQYYLANGANLTFKKDVFYNLNGYDGNIDTASGDDVFLVNKAAKAHYHVAYLKNNDASVTTYAQSSFEMLLHQRKRWATKTKSYANANIILIQGLVFCLNLYIAIALILGPICCTCLFLSGILSMLIKLITDFLFLKKMALYFHFTHNVRRFIPSFLLYSVMILYMGMQAIWPSKYQWKGVTIEK